jgi:hypothetical protein
MLKWALLGSGHVASWWYGAYSLIIFAVIPSHCAQPDNSCCHVPVSGRTLHCSTALGRALL